ncbi:hypothetical protein JJB63_10655 [Clostridium perfringens]|uniref:Uncharacterized protein n=1 Tax=Clostridium perfringens F262 TaxID=883064 RepID=A0AAV3F9C4_CLOPF|nr:hypothetical protein [Clostridium perfringens]EIA15992.1 hypothetical protein HA1_13072 [Clostridium perfringens F262]ELC8367510.1 hypothetical protein [Clostridium perfringens]MBO3326075.1 hypothetical protein [Clostridium perfringens]MBO3345197.1 hypothetical protein [Clostridium perfringens]MBO3348286.1 hypothetical protein [Clostridium perfringens]
MAGIAELKKFKERKLVKLTRENIEKEFEDFFNDKDCIKWNLEKVSKDLDALRGRN